MKLKNILFITSFAPVILFKIVSRLGGATLAQAQIATVIGLILAGIQFTLSKQFLKYTTYQDKAFLGFLGFGTAWLYLVPPPLVSLYIDYSTTFLYSVLFLTTLLPQLFGYDPFTYAVAKQWYPETVWKVPQFRLINLHITYVWSCLFLLAALSSWLGNGKPLFYIVIPLILLLGIGLPFSKKYPDYYLKRTFTTTPIDPSFFPATARELISRMPSGFDPEVARDLKAEIQFVLSGVGGGEMVLSISDRRCTFREGKTPTPTLSIFCSGDMWLKMAKGEISRPKALMEGLYRVEGDMGLLVKMGDLFRAPTKAKEEFIKKGEKTMKILAVQGSPRPKASNTDILLQEFLKGARSQSAETETVYLKQKDIHPCVGCYTCWTKTPGVCIFKDDMPELLEKVRHCSILVYATPLYNFNMTSLLKAFQERLLPLLDPHLVKSGDTYRHPQRYDVNRKIVLVATCGFPEASHFEGLRHVFCHIERNGEAPVVGELLMPGGEVLKQEGLRERIQDVLQAAYRAGVEVVRDGRVSKETEAQIQRPLIAPEELAEMANLWWDSHLEGITQGKPTQGKTEDIRLLLRGMAATFNPRAAKDLKATIQFEVAGKQPGNWFFTIENGKCSYNEGRANSPNLTIQTPSEVWLAISNHELDGQQAFMNGKYSVQGDVGLLMQMKNLFGNAT